MGVKADGLNRCITEPTASTFPIPESAVSHDVTVVPTFAPIITGTACDNTSKLVGQEVILSGIIALQAFFYFPF